MSRDIRQSFENDERIDKACSSPNAATGQSLDASGRCFIVDVYQSVSFVLAKQASKSNDEIDGISFSNSFHCDDKSLSIEGLVNPETWEPLTNAPKKLFRPGLVRSNVFRLNSDFSQPEKAATLQPTQRLKARFDNSISTSLCHSQGIGS